MCCILPLHVHHLITVSLSSLPLIYPISHHVASFLLLKLLYILDITTTLTLTLSYVSVHTHVHAHVHTDGGGSRGSGTTSHSDNSSRGHNGDRYSGSGSNSNSGSGSGSYSSQSQGGSSYGKYARTTLMHTLMHTLINYVKSYFYPVRQRFLFLPCFAHPTFRIFSSLPPTPLSFPFLSFIFVLLPFPLFPIHQLSSYSLAIPTFTPSTILSYFPFFTLFTLLSHSLPSSLLSPLPFPTFSLYTLLSYSLLFPLIPSRWWQ